MSSKEGNHLKDKVKRMFSKKTSSSGEKAGKGADAYRPMSGSIKGTDATPQSGTDSVPDSKATSATHPVEASNTPAEVNSGGAKNLVSGHGAEAGSSTATPEAASVPDVYQDVTEPANEDTGANRHWEAAREKTRAAELEAERAQRATAKANDHLKSATAAQGLVQDHADKHRKALADADAIRSSIGDPALLQQDVNAAKEHHDSKRLAHEEVDKKLQAAQAEHAEKAKLAEERKPIVDEHYHKRTTLEEEYDKHVEEVKARESNKGELLAIADNHKRDLDQHNTDIDALTAELSKADEIAAEREREFITAKDAAAALRARLAESKEKRGPMQELYLAKQGEADGADEAIQGYRHESETLKRKLEEEEESWRREQNTERNYQQDADDAAARLAALKAEAEPHSQALRQAEDDLNNRQKALDKAQAQSKEAQAKYDALKREADHHQAEADKAAEAARKHQHEHQALSNQAQQHHSRHRELWEEAKTHGTEGSNIASSVVKKLEEKVEDLLHGDTATEA
ncbi:hypothetical protein WJX73_006098 [Symbiochloris irregularis]|uniref:Uncharacterized protein n=1 Tax=Symbiochloris irregularis TaxID=706552 RepID=A0AAW1PB05_9CHLO